MRALAGVRDCSEGQGLRDTEKVDTAVWDGGPGRLCVSVPCHEHPVMGHLLGNREVDPCVRLVGPGRRCHVELL